MKWEARPTHICNNSHTSHVRPSRLSDYRLSLYEAGPPTHITAPRGMRFPESRGAFSRRASRPASCRALLHHPVEVLRVHLAAAGAVGVVEHALELLICQVLAQLLGHPLQVREREHALELL